MKKWLTFLFCFGASTAFGVNLPSVNTPGKVIPGPEGRNQYINQLSSSSAGTLLDVSTKAAADGKALVWCSTCGTGGKFTPQYVSSGTQLIRALDENLFLAKISSINCVGAGVTCTATLDLLTITVPGGSGGGSSGGAGAIFNGVSAQAVSTWTIPGTQVFYDGVGFATVAVADSSYNWTASQVFIASMTASTISATGFTMNFSSFVATQFRITSPKDEGTPLSSATATALIEGPKATSFNLVASPTLRFMAHGDMNGSLDVSQATVAYFDHKIRSVASTFNKQNAIYTFSNMHGIPIWSADNYNHFKFYTPDNGAVHGNSYSSTLTDYFSVGSVFFITAAGEIQQGAVNFSVQRSSTDALFNTVISSVMALSVSTDATKTFMLTNQSTVTALFNNVISSVNALSISTDAVKTFMLNNQSTVTAVFNTVISSVMALGGVGKSTDTLLSLQKATSTAVTIFQNAVGVDTTTLANRAATLVAFQNGTRKGDFTALDFSGTAVNSFSCSGTTCTLVLTAGAGGVGGGGAVFLYNGSGFVTVSTHAFPGSTIASDGQGGSSITYIPAINSTWTFVIANITTTSIQLTQIAGFSAASGTVLSVATAAFKTSYDLFTASVQKQMVDAFTFAAASSSLLSVSTDALKSRIDIAFSTIQKQMVDAFTFSAASAAIAFTSTEALRGFIAATGTALMAEILVVQTSTQLVSDQIKVSTGQSTASLYFTPHLWVAQTFSSGVFNSSLTVMDVLTSTRGMLAPSATFFFLNVSGSSIAFQSYTLVMPTGPAQVGQVLTIAQINGNFAVAAWATPSAPSAGGGYSTIQEEGGGLTQRSVLNFIGSNITCVDNSGNTRTDCTVSASGGGGGGGAAFAFAPANGNVASSTFSINGSEFNKLTYDGTAGSTFTIGTSTLPYIRLAVPATAIKGRIRQFSGSDTGGGISITTNPSTTPDGDGKLEIEYFSFAPSTRQYGHFQTSWSSGGTNSWMIGSTISFNYSGFVSSGAGAGKQVSLALQGTCLGANSNIQTTAWGSSVTVNLPDITSNFVIRDSTKSASITLGGTCFGDSLITFRISRNVDGNDTMAGATGQYFNLTGVGIFYRKGDVYQDERYAQ